MVLTGNPPHILNNRFSGLSILTMMNRFKVFIGDESCPTRRATNPSPLSRPDAPAWGEKNGYVRSKICLKNPPCD